MSPNVNEAVVRDRIQQPLDHAEHRRLARIARAGQRRRTGLHGLKDAVGLGLIAIGERLMEQSPTDTDDLRRAA